MKELPIDDPHDPFGYFKKSRYWSLWVPTEIFKDYDYAGVGVGMEGGDTRLCPPKIICGFFYASAPFHRSELWYDLRVRYKELDVWDIEGKAAVVCKMEIANRINAQENLMPADFADDDGLKKTLDKIAEKPAFLPWLSVRFDARFGYWRAEISPKSLDLSLNF